MALSLLFELLNEFLNIGHHAPCFVLIVWILYLYNEGHSTIYLKKYLNLFIIEWKMIRYLLNKLNSFMGKMTFVRDIQF